MHQSHAQQCTTLWGECTHANMRTIESGSIGVTSTHKFNGPVKLMPILAIPEECNFYKQFLNYFDKCIPILIAIIDRWILTGLCFFSRFKRWFPSALGLSDRNYKFIICDFPGGLKLVRNNGFATDDLFEGFMAHLIMIIKFEWSICARMTGNICLSQKSVG